MRPCFDPSSYICQGCILTEKPEEIILFHMSHLEFDHGIKIEEREDGVVKMDMDEFLRKGGHHTHF